jgi:opacity protein-like surface antigen
MHRRTPHFAPLTLLVAFIVPGPAAADPVPYVRAAIGFESSGDTTVGDLDCASVEPPALFGCVAGNDGRPLAARGDFGDTEVWEVAAGLEVGLRWRFELALAGRSGLDLDAEANFPGVAGEQPVRADGRSVSLLAIAAVDLAPEGWRFRPYVAAGAGAARNRTGEVTYAFPSLAPGAVTIIQGGAHTDLAWTAAVGASFPLGDSTALELTLRHTDLGELRTDSGEATIVRARGTFLLDIAGTRADVETTGLTLSLRHRL